MATRVFKGAPHVVYLLNTGAISVFNNNNNNNNNNNYNYNNNM
jgi:hypothetical protein